jgi:hypothetical protein
VKPIPSGIALKSQAHSGEVTLVMVTEQPHRNGTPNRVPAMIRVLLARLRSLCVLAWVTTLRLEIYSLYFRIRDIREKGLVCRYEMGLACQSCQTRKTPQWCKHIRACNDHIKQLLNLYPWLSYTDRNLLVEGWNLASRLMPDSLDCGISFGSKDVLAFEETPGGNSMPPQATQQDSKHERLNLLPLQE